MATEKDVIIKEELKYAGLGNFRDIYNFTHDWLISDNYKVIEEKYTEKIKGNEKELEIVWKAKKLLSDYFRSTIEMKWTIRNMTDVEVEVDGKRKQMNKFGYFKLAMKGILEKDVLSKWTGTAMQQFFKDMYHKYVIPQRIEDREDKIKDTVRELKDEVKAYLELTGLR